MVNNKNNIPLMMLLGTDAVREVSSDCRSICLRTDNVDPRKRNVAGRKRSGSHYLSKYAAKNLKAKLPRIILLLSASIPVIVHSITHTPRDTSGAGALRNGLGSKTVAFDTLCSYFKGK